MKYYIEFEGECPCYSFNGRCNIIKTTCVGLGNKGCPAKPAIYCDNCIKVGHYGSRFEPEEQP